MTNIAIPDLISIPSGSFQLGSPPSDPLANENEKTLEQINLPFFQISKYPITNAEYALFIASENHEAPLHWHGKKPPENLLHHPVVHVNIIDAMIYCGWLSQQTGFEFTVPTEMQWEKAARGTEDIRRYVWGDIWISDACNTSESGIGETTAVSQFEDSNVSPFGVVDLLGNVWEWTKSDYLQLPGSTYESVRFGTSYKVVRGGSWHNDQTLARISCRGRYIPGKKRPYLGFRIVTPTNIEQTQPVEKPASTPTYPPNMRPRPKTGDEAEETLTDKAELRKKILNSFSREELRTICFDMNINTDLFPDDIEVFSRKLIEYCQRRDLLASLKIKLKAERPNIKW